MFVELIVFILWYVDKSIEKLKEVYLCIKYKYSFISCSDVLLAGFQTLLWISERKFKNRRKNERKK